MTDQPILLIVTGTVALMLMAFSLVFFVSLYRRRILENKLTVQEMQTKHQQEMLSATLKSQESERNRLGTELHDGVGAMLSTIKMSLQVSQRSNSLDNLGNILEVLGETIGQVRTISHEMMPVVLKKYGLEKAVLDLFEKVSRGGDVKAEVVHWDEVTFDESDSLMLFRIMQELTNNSLKHADASLIQIETYDREGTIHFIYKDNGKGFPQQVLEKVKGMGLWNILNRAQTVGAEVTFSNQEKGGARVELVINKSNTSPNG